MKYLTDKQTKEAQALSAEMGLMLIRLRNAGLHETALLFESGPLQQIGHELERKACYLDPERAKQLDILDTSTPQAPRDQ